MFHAPFIGLRDKMFWREYLGHISSEGENQTANSGNCHCLPFDSSDFVIWDFSGHLPRAILLLWVRVHFIGSRIRCPVDSFGFVGL
jgi:hypothetical protein